MHNRMQRCPHFLFKKIRLLVVSFLFFSQSSRTFAIRLSMSKNNEYFRDASLIIIYDKACLVQFLYFCSRDKRIHPVPLSANVYLHAKRCFNQDVCIDRLMILHAGNFASRATRYLRTSVKVKHVNYNNIAANIQ